MAAAIKSELGVDAEIWTGRRGAFEVTRDGKSIFSRLNTGRFPTPEEVLDELGDD